MVIANAVHKASDFVNKLCSILCVVMLIAMVVITGMQIIFRVFFTALSWSEEATRYLLVWSTFIGGSVVYKAAGHISVTLVTDHCPARIQKVLKGLVHIICGVFCTVAVFAGFQYMAKQGTQLSAALRIPMRFMYMAIPVGCISIDLHIVDAILQLFVQKDEEVFSA